MCGVSPSKLKRFIKVGEIKGERRPAKHGGLEFKIPESEMKRKPNCFLPDDRPYCRRVTCRFNTNGCTILTECLDKLMKPCPFFKPKGSEFFD